MNRSTPAGNAPVAAQATYAPAVVAGTTPAASVAVPAASAASSTSTTTSAPYVEAERASRDAGVPALAAPSPWVDLPIEGYEPAIVSLPLGALGRRPVVVAAQGLAETPKEWCEWWRDRIGDRGFVLCPRGAVWGRLPSGNTGHRYISAAALEQEVLRGLDALAARYPLYVDPGPVLFAGFSMGANMGAEIVLHHPKRFPRAILIEGGNTDWNDRSSRKFANDGGTRILFACGTEGCSRWAKFSKRRLDRNGVATRVALGPSGGHRYQQGPVYAALVEALAWIFEGDDRW